MKKPPTKFTPEEDELILKCVAKHSHNLTYGFEKLITSGKIKDRKVRDLLNRYYSKLRYTKPCFMLLDSKHGTNNRKNVWRGREKGALLNKKEALTNLKNFLNIYF